MFEASTTHHEPHTIRCYLDVTVILMTWQTALSRERLLAAQAMKLLIRLDTELREARANWNQDRFRRLMVARLNAVIRLRRRWATINPPLQISPGSVRRRYHANLAGYLYHDSFREKP
jgi:hypothetical protein